MAEPHKTCARYNDPGHAHSLTFSCHHRLPLLQDDQAKWLLIHSLAAARTRHRFDLWAYVIMPTHVHLLIFPREDHYSISTILAAIKRPVAYHARRLPSWVASNPCHTSTPFWQPGGGYDRNLFKSHSIHAEIDYIHNNPVRKNLCSRPEDWPFSSARFWLGHPDTPLPMDPTVPLLSPVRDL